MNSRPRTPKYRQQKARGLAVVTLDGKDHYLGPYNSPESWEQYHRLIAEHFKQRGAPVVSPTAVQSLSIQRLTLAYIDYAETYYLKDGKITSEVACIHAALRPLLKLYATTAAVEFGPLAFKLVREELIKTGVLRTTVNQHVSRIKRMFRWAVANELLPVSVHQALATVPGLRKGRSTAKESKPIRPVDDSAVEAILPLLPPTVAAMVKLQRLSGGRPSEICKLRPCDVDRSGDVWCYRPESHKTEHHDLEKRIYLGPKAQEVLLPWLDRAPASYCFSPAESSEQQRAAKHARRRVPLKYGNRPGSNRTKKPKRQPGDRYTDDSYRRAVARACRTAKIAVWSPNRLRHTQATQLRSQFGLDAAQVVLGHTKAFVTQMYAERDFKKAEEIMRQVG